MYFVDEQEQVLLELSFPEIMAVSSSRLVPAPAPHLSAVAAAQTPRQGWGSSTVSCISSVCRETQTDRWGGRGLLGFPAGHGAFEGSPRLCTEDITEVRGMQWPALVMHNRSVCAGTMQTPQGPALLMRVGGGLCSAFMVVLRWA